MANPTVNLYNFYQKYNWTPQDFANFQLALLSVMGGLAEGLAGSTAILGGLQATPGGGMNVTIQPGIGFSNQGSNYCQMLAVSTVQTVAVAAPVGGNPCNALIVLRPSSVANNFIAQPTAPGNQVALNQQMSWTLVAINGVSQVNPQYPATQTGDIIVAALRLPASTATVTTAMFDWGTVARPAPRQRKIISVASAYTVQPGDEIIEVAATGGNVPITMSPAASNVGTEVTVIKVDSTANTVSVAGQGGDLLSGQATLILEDTWGQARMYASAGAQATNPGWRLF